MLLNLRNSYRKLRLFLASTFEAFHVLLKDLHIVLSASAGAAHLGSVVFQVNSSSCAQRDKKEN